jgi:molecular chaperone DnaK (HSP70)
VALGAGVLASRLAGHAVERVLVDVSPYSFGVSYLGERGGYPYPHCYHPIVTRNTPLPVTRTERYATNYPYQTAVDIRVFQGDDEDALKNVLVGDFTVEGLTPVEEPNEILCRMQLDLDGILGVTAVEKRTGKSKHVTIANALTARSEAEVEAGRRRIQQLYETRGAAVDEEAGDILDLEDEDWDVADVVETEATPLETRSVTTAEGEDVAAAHRLLERSRSLLERMHDDDREEAIGLHERIEAAIEAGDATEVRDASRALGELLFFIEGHAT